MTERDGARPPMTSDQRGWYEATFHLVERYAREAASRPPQTLELDELRSIGTLAHRRAVVEFDPSHGVELEDFAKGRIRWALFHARRAEDRAARAMRAMELVGADFYATASSDWDVLCDDDETLTSSRLVCADLATQMFVAGARQAAPATPATPEEALIDAQEGALALRALDGAAERLSPELLPMIECIARRQTPLTEIAKEMGLSYPAARKLRARALAEMRLALEQQGVREPPSRMEG